MPHTSTVSVFSGIIEIGCRQSHVAISVLMSVLSIVILNTLQSITILNGIPPLPNTYTLNFFMASITARTSNS